MWVVHFTFKITPVAIGMSSEGLCVRWQEKLNEKDKKFNNIAWVDIECIYEEKLPVTNKKSNNDRTLIVTDKWAKMYRIDQIDDICADAILKEWKKGSRTANYINRDNPF